MEASEARKARDGAKYVGRSKGILSDTQLSQCGLSWSQWVVNGFLVVWVSSLCMDLGKHARSDNTPHLCNLSQMNHTPKWYARWKYYKLVHLVPTCAISVAARREWHFFSAEEAELGCSALISRIRQLYRFYQIFTLQLHDEISLLSRQFSKGSIVGR